MHLHNDQYLNNQKLLSREELLIDTYRQTFNEMSVEKGKHLVSLCGSNSHKGLLHPHSEVSQFIADDFIFPEQYVGVDQDHDIIANNKKVTPAIKYVSGQIDDVLKQHKWITPQVVFFDSNHMGKTKDKVIEPFSRTLKILARYDHPIFVAYNWVGVTHKQKLLPEEALLILSKSDTFQEALTLAEWKICTEYYHYKNGSSWLYCFWFIKKARKNHPETIQLRHIKATHNRTFGGWIRPFSSSVQNIVTSINERKAMLDQKALYSSINRLVNTIESAYSEILNLQKSLDVDVSSTSPQKHEKDPKRVTAGYKARATTLAKQGDTHKKKKEKDPKWVTAGHKAYQTRLKNQGKK